MRMGSKTAPTLRTHGSCKAAVWEGFTKEDNRADIKGLARQFYLWQRKARNSSFFGSNTYRCESLGFSGFYLCLWA